jgi:hypothetical protein
MENPDFHPMPHGGIRKVKFSTQQLTNITSVIWQFVHDHPRTTRSSIVRQVGQTLNVSISPTTISRLFRAWGWSWKIPSHVQLQKFTAKNIRRYVNFIVWVLSVPWTHLKFLDEAHFVSRGIKSRFFHNLRDIELYRQKAVSPIGCPIVVLESTQLDLSFTVTLMTTLTKPGKIFALVGLPTFLRSTIHLRRD